MIKFNSPELQDELVQFDSFFEDVKQTMTKMSEDIVALENYLKEKSYPFEVEVECFSEDDGNYINIYWLSWCQGEGGWRIYVHKRGECPGTRALGQLPVRLRSKVYKHLPQLLEKMRNINSMDE